MDIAAILAIVGKGIATVETALSLGQEVAPALQALANLVSGAQQGTVTDDQLAATEAVLDQMIEDFNQPIDDDASRDK